MLIQTKSLVYEQKTIYVSMVPCLLGFIFNVNVDFVRDLCHTLRFGDRFFVLNYCKKDQHRGV